MRAHARMHGIIRWGNGDRRRARRRLWQHLWYNRSGLSPPSLTPYAPGLLRPLARASARRKLGSLALIPRGGGVAQVQLCSLEDVQLGGHFTNGRVAS